MQQRNPKKKKKKKKRKETIVAKYTNKIVIKRHCHAEINI